ncbi:DinB family protein [Bacteroidota bacterium]
MKKQIISQFQASLDMLDFAITNCPEKLWKDDGAQNPYWLIAYHALFFTHLYLQENLEGFSPWEKHIEGYQGMKFDKGKFYTKEEMLVYLALCKEEVIEKIDSTDLNIQNSGFHWLPFDKIELQFYNIRHIQHHAGQLYDRLRTAGIKGKWVAQGSNN